MATTLESMEVTDRFFKSLYAHLIVNTGVEYDIGHLRGMPAGELADLLSRELIALRVENGRLLSKEGA